MAHDGLHDTVHAVLEVSLFVTLWPHMLHYIISIKQLRGVVERLRNLLPDSIHTVQRMRHVGSDHQISPHILWFHEIRTHSK